MSHSARPAVAPYLLANNSDGSFSPMWRAAVFEEKDPLPRSKLHLPIHNRYCLVGARQCHPDMRWHIIAALRTMREIIGIFRHKPFEKFLQIASRGRISIFHNENAATGVLNEHSQRPVTHSAPVDLRLQIISDFVQALAVRPNSKSIIVNVHKLSGRIYHVLK
jgi:hypothetical protein